MSQSEIDTHHIDSQFASLFRGSRYCERILAKHPQWRDWLIGVAAQSAVKTVAELPLPPADDGPTLDRTLRLARQQVMLAILFRDLNQLADLDEVVTAISLFADRVIQCALAFHRAALCTQFNLPVADPPTNRMSDLMVIGMGKLGGNELNVSSDIDLIFVHAEDGEANADKSWHEFHTQLGQRVMRSIDQIDDHGFVFRVDMRLRPFGASGPLVTSLASLADYFVKHARPWERYAWLKARAVTGDAGNIDALDALVRPFVFRRYHDYAAIDEMRSLHAQIRAEATKRGKQDDIKVGAGGIREIEFVAQIHQLIRGGRETALQTRSTRAALDLLASLQILPPPQVDALQSAYRFLRNLEHRLQYLDDAQTQMLPGNNDDRQRIAESMLFADWAAFDTALAAHRQAVTHAFESLFGDSSGALSKNETLITTGVSGQKRSESPADIALFTLDEQPEISRRLDAWVTGSRMASLSPKLRERLERLIKLSMPACAAVDQSQHTLFRVWSLLEAIDKRETYLALLIEYPGALTRVVRIANKSAWAAEFLRRHPVLLHELVQPAPAQAGLDWVAQRATLQAACDAANDDVERQYELLRHAKQVATLKLNIADIEGRMSVMTLSDELSALADMLLDVTLVLASRALALSGAKDATDWSPPTGFSIIGYGKLGSKELGYASDLDLVFLYDDATEGNGERFAKLAQRLSSWLNTMTAGGVLYETDLRLRPDGAAGLLVSSLTAFCQYQKTRAWTWEHQALTRARWCAGDAALAAPFDAIREDVLIHSDNSNLKSKIVEMRDKMRAEKKDRSNVPLPVNLKHTRGGIVDVEFIVQYLILAYSREHPEFLKNLGNFALLTRAAALGIIDEDLAAKVGKAYLAYRERQHRARTNNEAETWVGLDELTDERQAVSAAWSGLFGIDR